MAAVSSSSNSVHWRQEGNRFYKIFQERDYLPNCLKKSYLTDAINNYYKAYNTADDADEKSSAAKNVGIAAWKLGGVHRDLKAKFSLQHYFHREAITYFDRAQLQGKDVKSEAWFNSLKDSYQRCVQDAIDILSEVPYDDKVIALEQYVHVMSDENSHKADVYIEMGQQVFRSGIVSLGNGDYKKALCAMKECYRPTEEARRLAGGREYILEEVRVLEADYFMHQCAAESIQSRTTGDQLFDVLTKDLEDLNMTLVYEVLDWYKKSILLTRESEVEMEAIALSRLGKVYDMVLKQKYKAKDNFMRCVQLAHSLHPRTFHSQEWFQTATSTLEKYQQEVLKKEQEEWQKKRQKYVKELDKELKELKKKADANRFNDLSDSEFLRYIYKTFPPKKKTHKLPTKAKLEAMERSEMKKVFMKAVTHYHPDKMKEHGEKWVVLCEEVTKLLTAKYENYKG